jgi:D-glycero-alpha-D-manno-heptose 1-phosphate guanylyltransferase
MITKEAIVLAGGLGTRLQSVLPGIPKCMAPVKGKPFLEFVLDYLIQHGVNKVILSVGYRKDQIISYFGNQYQSLNIDYAIEDHPLGTGGAVKFAFNYCVQDQVFVINGDTYFNPDLQMMEKRHFQTKADISIAVKHLSETGRYGLVQANTHGRITDFREKDTFIGGGWINGGIYLINRRIIDDFHSEKFSVENDIFNTSCKKFHLQAFQSDAFFLDIGIPDDYNLAQTLINRATNK